MTFTVCDIEAMAIEINSDFSHENRMVDLSSSFFASRLPGRVSHSNICWSIPFWPSYCLHIASVSQPSRWGLLRSATMMSSPEMPKKKLGPNDVEIPNKQIWFKKGVFNIRGKGLIWLMEGVNDV